MTDPRTETTEAADAKPEGDAPSATESDAAQATVEAITAGEDPAVKLVEVEAERDALKNKLMYALADLENLRKRAERDRRDAEAFGGSRLARDLLSVHDNLERAVDAADDTLRTEHAAFFEGVELTRKELLNAFAKHKIEKVEPQKGDLFDPNFHQAMFEAPVPGAENGAIIEIMQCGFTISGRLLRAAMVGVAKGAPAPDASGDTAQES
jgi:molecular chaperone GrpE